MSWEKARQLAQLMDELTENFAAATLCMEEIRALVQAQGDGHEAGGAGDWLLKDFYSSKQRPQVDPRTLSVVWAGKNCYLGYTISFKLVARLARRPNHFVAMEDLLRDVWEGDRKSPNTIRSAIRNLKQRLQEAGMNDLAATIQSEGGRYAMLLGS